MFRRMETLEKDQILTNIQSMWKGKLPCGWKADEDPIPGDKRVVGAGHPVTTPHSRVPGGGGVDVQLQQGEDIDTPPSQTTGQRS